MRFLKSTLLLLCLVSSSLSLAASDESKSIEDLVKNENPFSLSYVESKPSNAKRLVTNAEPKLFTGKDKIVDKHRMDERGFELIGYSDFQAGDVAPEMVIPQAKKVNADTVLLYTERANSVPASVRMQQMRDAKKAGQTDNAAISYKYFASYWAKLAKPSLGVHVKVPEKDEQVEGLVVLVVMEGSSAQAAGLMADDTLVSIGDVQLMKVEDLSKAVQQYAGQEVEYVYIRDRMRHQAKLTLN